MEKLSVTSLIMFFVMAYIYAGNVDFRNIYTKEDSKTEAVVKISSGLLSDIESNEKGTYISSSDLTIFPYTSTSVYGNISRSHNSRNSVFDLAFEIHYFMYEKFGIGGGLSIPLNVDIPYVNAYLINPYISFKIKNFTNKEELNNFYLLLNLGTIIPIYADSRTASFSLGYDIGVGYEYNNFIFEILYSCYSIKFDSFSVLGVYSDYYNLDDYTRYYYSEHIFEENIDISRLRFVIGYKFDM